MFKVSEYVKVILRKKNMTNMDLVRAINKVEEQAGLSSRVVKQNVTNYLNGYFEWGYEFTRKVEVALGLKDKTLLNLLPIPKTKSDKELYKTVLKKYKVVK